MAHLLWDSYKPPACSVPGTRCARQRTGKGSLRKRDLLLSCASAWVNNSTATALDPHCVSFGKKTQIHKSRPCVLLEDDACLFSSVSDKYKSLEGQLDNEDQLRNVLVFLNFCNLLCSSPRHLLYIFEVVVFQRLWICLRP